MISFNEKYNVATFSSFLRDFLPTDYVEKEREINQLVGCQIITSAKELGFCESLDLTVLEMSHGKNTDPRVTIATDAFKILKNYDIQKALVIFKNDDSENYRFSYLTVTLDIDEKNKIQKTYSNARRYSFYLGVGAKVRTPEQQLTRKGRLIDIADLLSRFSVEVVNKQFYLEVAKFFDELVSPDTACLALPFQTDLNIRKSFAVRLIGRLMFCWFLKQKKSYSGQLVPDEILSSTVVSEHYYHSILEPLFFGILNTEIESRDIRSELFDKVPYLNGGLFNPQSDDYYELDREIFVSKYINTLKIDDSWFKRFFELLETYNFTIDENTVFDQELSVDPEMLGRIFENLLAEINPETGSSERKRTGSFYTPRPIVEYMVDQSLIEYLKTKTDLSKNKISALVSYDQLDDLESPLVESEKKEVLHALEAIKILDPACGSGAYPIGVLQKIVYILKQVDPDCKLSLEQKLKGVPDLYKQKIISEVTQNPFEYTRKLDVIKNSIFGVDIQPIAVDVSRLRCFLTLVVESEINDTKPNRGIQALPNLDFKFVCANTLIALPKSESNNLFEDHLGIEELSGIMSEYFTANRSEKGLIKTRFFNKQKDLLNRMIELKAAGELTLKLTLWDPFSNKTNSWFDPEWMFGLEEKFDVVIGNPPYIKEYTSRGAFISIKQSPYYQGKMDLWYMFACNSLDLLKQDGVECFIAQNNWVTSSGASKMRNKIIKEAQILSLVDFGDYKIFETAGIQTMVMLFRKTTEQQKYNFDYRSIISSVSSFTDVTAMLAKAEGSHIQYLEPQITRDTFIDKKLVFNNTVVEVILENILRKSNFHLTSKEVANGIHHHHDQVNRDRKTLLGGNSEVGDGIFVLSEKEKAGIQFTVEEHALIKPAYTTKELHKWYGEVQNKDWVIYTDSSFKDISKINAYPNLKSHLDKFSAVITSDNKPYGLHRSREENFFVGEKIIVARKCASPAFTYTDFDAYVSATFYIIKTDRVNQKYLTGILNSKLVAFWLKNKGKMQGSNYQIDKEPILEIPIFLGNDSQQAEIVSVVDGILNAKSTDYDCDVTILESKINELIMDLYNLSEDEKETIRNS